jgi:hypothetical protein
MNGILLNTRTHSIGISTVNAVEYCVPASCSVCGWGGEGGEKVGERAAVYRHMDGQTRDLLYLCYLYNVR